MRRCLHIILIVTVQLSSFIFPLFGQSYLHEPTIWKQYLRWYSFPLTFTEEFTIELIGDTLINGKVYFKTLKSGIMTTTNVEGQSSESPIYEYTFPIREEDQKFYIYNQDVQQEILLHDFDLSVGDVAVAGSNCDNKTVVWIDSVYIGNIPRKRFHLNGGFNFVTLIEGIGASRGLFFYPCNDVGVPVFLECFIQDQSYLQLVPDVDCSSLVSTETNSDAELSIYPNPFTQELNIQVAGSSLQPASIRITNLLGTIVYQSFIDLAENLERINLERIPPGMYIVYFRTKDVESSFKVIKH